MLSSEARNRALADIIQVLREHNFKLAQSVDRWDRLEDAYCAHLAKLEGVSPLTMKRRMRKEMRERTVGTIDAYLMTGKHGMQLVQAPSRLIE